MTGFEQIKAVVTEYQKKVDRHFQDYSRRVERARQRYSDEAFREESRKIWIDVGSKVDVARGIAKNEIDLIVEDIEKDFRKWLVKPLDGNLIQTLNCIRNFEIHLGIEELRVLEEETKNSFFGSRIFSEIAKENGYYVKTPDSKTFMSALKRVHDNAVTAVTAYAGHYPDLIGKDLLEEDKPVYALVMASNFLTKNDSIKEAEELWGISDIPREFKLSKEEEKRIYDLIDNIENETEKQERIKQLSSVEPDFMDKLALMDGEYKEAVEGYLDTGRLDYVYEDNSEQNVRGYGR
ncbi:MAG: hypothetical protein KH441_13495 [Clostridium sp.]|nr:hypothetical protein [Clostridium sp.]